MSSRVIAVVGPTATGKSALAIALADRVVDDVPADDDPWQPGTSVPDELAGVIGRWFSEGRGFTFAVREGRLEARHDGVPATRAPSVFEAVGEDRYRTASGRERGELLRITRGAGGRAERLHWATYLVFVLGTLHGIAAGTDTWALPLYLGAVGAVTSATAWRALARPTRIVKERSA